MFCRNTTKPLMGGGGGLLFPIFKIGKLEKNLLLVNYLDKVLSLTWTQVSDPGPN